MMARTPATLERVGQALFGTTWLNQMAAELQINDRTLRHFMSERDPIPDGVWRDVERLCRSRGELLISFADMLASTGGGFQTEVRSEMRRPAPRR